MGIAASASGYDAAGAPAALGASGIGQRLTAKLVAELGAEVVVADDLVDGAFDVAKTLHLDLRDPASVEAAVSACDGPIHALFSCAGILERRR